jgi:enterobactin synthetase component F
MTPRERPPSAAAPLTEAQEGLWFAQRIDPSNPVFNTGQYLDIRGRFDAGLFRASITKALDEADALAVRIEDRDGTPRLVPAPEARAVVETVDLRDAADPEAAARAWMDRDMATPIDPARGPLTAEVLFDLGADRWFWYQRIHHVVIDGYGTALLTARVCELYRAACEGTPAGHAFGSFADVVADAAEYRASPRRETDRRYWLDALAGIENVASLAEGTALTSHSYLRAEAGVGAAGATALQSVAAAAKAPWPDVLVALAGAYTARHTGEAEVVVGVATMNRLGTPAARVPAMVMNILPLRIAIDEDEPLPAFATRVAKSLRDARRRGRYCGEQVRRDLGLVGVSHRLYGPLVNVLPFDDAPSLPGAAASLHVLGTGPVDDITLTMRADSAGAGLRVEIDANPALYSQAAVDGHAKRLAAFVEAALQAPSLAVVPTVTPDEQRRWITDVNDTAHEVVDATLTTLIERTMQRQPEAAALEAEGRSLTYRDLDDETAALAAALHARGVRRGDIVAVLLPRSRELVVSLLGTVRAAAAYLPLDPEHPRDRIATMLESAKPRLVLTVAALSGRLPAAVESLVVDDDLLARRGPPPAIDAARLDDPAYVIYTSGSTGEPKGAMIEHRAIVNRLEWMRTEYGIGPGDRILQKTPATFDVSVWEFFLPFTSGAALAVAPPEAHKDPSWLARILRERRITTVHFVPSMLAVFLADPAAAGLSIARVFVSGEALSAALRDRFHQVVNGELHNLYGPTEAAVDVTYWNAGREDRSAPVPIGRPVWNTRMYVLDGRRRALPPETPGDLYIAGVQLAREYVGRPDLTGERFVADPFHPGSRMYMTGDRARWRRDGAIEFLGRSDHQVKVRGVRIELGEIEAAVRDSVNLAHVVVLAREDQPGDQRLVAYLVRHDGAPLDVDALRARLAERLPSSMVPAAFISIPSLPVTRNGKLDRRALPAPAWGAPRTEPARSDSERRVARLFAEVLGDAAVDDIGRDDDFFERGGHSLLAARLMLAMREAFDVELSLGAVFAHPTVAALAAHVDALEPQMPVSGDAGLTPTIRLGPQRRGTVPLFCVHPAGGISWCYGTLARALLSDASVIGLQADGLDPAAPLPASLEDMARAYVDRLGEVQRSGPVHLCGWSVGGIIAQAMAVRLEELGREVATLAMLDAYPCDRWRHAPPPDARAALRALLLIAGVDPGSLGDVPLTRDAAINFLKRSGNLLGYLADDTLAGVVRLVDHNSRLVRQHRHRRFSGDVLYFRAARDHADDGMRPEEWTPYVGGLTVYDIDSLHAHLTRSDAVRQIAPVLRAAIAKEAVHD